MVRLGGKGLPGDEVHYHTDRRTRTRTGGREGGRVVAVVEVVVYEQGADFAEVGMF